MTTKEYANALHLLISCPDLQPHDGLTFCNYFVQEVAHLFGYRGFDGLMANQIVDVMEKGKPFYTVASPDYTFVSKVSKINPLFIVAGQKAEGHGHICVVSPLDGVTFSSKWKKTVCNVANVGKTVFENKGLNWAFATEPLLYLYQG